MNFVSTPMCLVGSWQFEDIGTEEVTYTLVKSNGKEFAGIWQIPTNQQAQIPPHWMAYILVADLVKALEKAKLHGAQEVKGITAVGEMGHFAIITDPTGAHLALLAHLALIPTPFRGEGVEKRWMRGI